MTVLVDRRKENYDELLALAGDARAGRTRTNRWTTGLIVSAIAGSGWYVATMNQQVNELRETATEAGEQADTIRSEYTRLLDERLALKGEVSELKRSLEYYARTSPTTPTPPASPQRAPSNVVWVVEGSRRFPVTGGDILWVPEGGFWIKLETKITHTVQNGIQKVDKEHRLTRYNSPLGVATSNSELMIWPYRTAVPERGSANCIEVNLHDPSTRPGFETTNYVDIEILYIAAPNCPP